MFKATAADGAARTGVLSTSHASIRTPALLLYTRRGGVMNLTPDMVDTLGKDASALQIDPTHFIEFPSPKLLNKHGGGAHGFCALQSFALIASPRDPTKHQYNKRRTGDDAVCVYGHHGASMLSVKGYMDVIEALRPDVYVAIGDEVVAEEASKRRVATSAKRSLRWLDECLKEHSQRQAALHSTQIWAGIHGGASEAVRLQSAREVGQRDVAGFALCGFGTGEDAADRAELIGAVLAELPAERPRLINALETPADMLRAAAQGVDLFDSGFIHSVTTAGRAVTFKVRSDEAVAYDAASADSLQLPPDASAASPSTAELESLSLSADPAGEPAASTAPHAGTTATAPPPPQSINLWDTAYQEDGRPLLPGCGCFACRHHTRAYIHHLLAVHEMLAGTLLEVHNTHRMLGFFENVRESIEAGRLAEYEQWFLAESGGAASPEVPDTGASETPEVVEAPRG